MNSINPISITIPNCYKSITNKVAIPPFSKDTVSKNGIQQFDKLNILYKGVCTPEYQEQLHKNRKFDELVNYGTVELFCNYPEEYKSVKNNKDFLELIDNGCFNSKEGFFNLLGIVSALRRKRADKIAHPDYCVPSIDYKKYDIPDYLRFLNNFAKSNISLDLKKYYIKENANKLYPYYKFLNRITPETDVLALMLAPPKYIY